MNTRAFNKEQCVCVVCVSRMSSESSSEDELVQSQEHQNTNRNQNQNQNEIQNRKKVKPNRQLRQEPLKRLLKSFIVSNVVQNYITIGLRVLWAEKDYSDMFERRSQLEEIIKYIKHVSLFVTSITAMEKHEETYTGFAVWLALDWPEMTSHKFEHFFCKKIMKSGFNIASCTVLSGRGKKYFIFQHILSLPIEFFINYVKSTNASFPESLL